jgi:hypothetical protein
MTSADWSERHEDSSDGQGKASVLKEKPQFGRFPADMGVVRLFNRVRVELKTHDDRELGVPPRLRSTHQLA